MARLPAINCRPTYQFKGEVAKSEIHWRQEGQGITMHVKRGSPDERRGGDKLLPMKRAEGLLHH